MTTEKEHHLYGGSTSRYWSNCHGWAGEVSKLPHEPAGVAADRGNALHKGILEGRVQAEINHLIKGTPVAVDYSSIPNWPPEGATLADEFWELLWTKVLEGFITGKVIYIEKKLMLYPDLDSGGTADLVIMYSNDKGKLVGVIGDLKFGRVSVNPDEEQLKFYLAALNKIAREKGKIIDVFKSFIYQPEDFPNFKEHTFTKSEIERAEAKYEKAITESKKPNPKFKVGDWCDWCKLRGGCAALTKHLDKEMELTVIRNQEMNTVQFRPPETIPDDVLVKIHKFKAKIKNYLSAVDKEIILRFANKKPVAGLKIVEGTTKSKIKDEKLAAEYLKGLGVNPYKEPELKGLGDLTKAVEAATGKKPKEAKEIVYQHTYKPEGPPKITSADDPKPDFVFKDMHNLLDGLDDDSEF